MARIDYFDIEETLADVLRADPALSGTLIQVEERIVLQDSDFVDIFLEEREAPDELQPIAAGKVTRYQLRLSVWCFGYALELKEAGRRRDALAAKVEIALMKNRSWHAQVGQSWIGGGRFDNRENEETGGLLSGVETRVIADVKAVA